LATDKGSSGNTNEKTKDIKSSSSVDKTSAADRNCSKAQNDTEKDTGTPFVTTRTKDETHKDGTTNTNNVRSPKVLLGEVKGFLDFWQERGDREPDEESNKKGEPRAVECSHVRTLEAKHLDLSGFVILVRVNTDIVGIVLLPLRRLRRGRVESTC
jgi:hypothetical protein